MNDDERDALLEELQPKRSILARIFTPRRQLMSGVFVVASVAGGLGLARVGMDGHLAITGLVLASPVLLVAVVGFIGHAWRQNDVPVLAEDVTDAEPGHLATQARQPLAKPATASQPTEPIRALPSVTVTVLPDFEEKLAGSPHLQSALRHLRERQIEAVRKEQTDAR